MDGPWTSSWPRLVTAVALAAVVAVSATGCASIQGLGGMGLPTLSTGELPDGELVGFEGVVVVGPQGCLMVRLTDPPGDAADRWAVWPPGADKVSISEEAGNGAVIDGETYAGEDRITGTGRPVDLADIPGGEEGGGYFRSSGTYCDALVGGVLVIDEVRPA